MFTVKLMKGEHNNVIKLVEAKEVEIRMNHCGGTREGMQHAIIVIEPGAAATETSWYYVGHPDWDMAVVENEKGKTTEVVRAPNDAPALSQNIGRAA